MPDGAGLHVCFVSMATMTGSFAERLRGFARPAFRAEPIAPYPLMSVMRWALLAIFLGYAAAGQLRSDSLAVTAALIIAPLHLVTSELLLFRSRRDPERLFKAWAWILVADVLAILVAGSADSVELSPIPLITVATIFSARTMFTPRYVTALTVLAAVGFLAAHVLRDLALGQTTYLEPVFPAVVIAATGLFAVTGGRAEAALRLRLSDSELREREQSETLREALRAAEESGRRLTAFSEHAPVALVLFDQRGTPTFASRFLEQILGPITSASYTRQMEMAEPDLEPRAAAIRKALTGQTCTAEFVLVDSENRRRTVSGIFFPVLDGAGAVLRDVSEERAVEEQVARTQRMETLGTLAGGIAHDFNNLLTAVLGNIHLARGRVTQDSEAVELLDDATLAAERGAELVRRLLDYSRPAVEASDLLSLARVVDETARIARGGLTPKVELVVGPIPEDSYVRGNFGVLQQVLLNLLVNGSDAMPGGGRLTISYSRVSRPPNSTGVVSGQWDAGVQHALLVSDTGTGIPKHLLARIFDPFFTTKDVGKGTGLGLAVALSAVRAHGGQLDVETHAGEGTTFRITLPAASWVAPPQVGARGELAP